MFAVGSSEFKLYDVKSGKIEYELKQSVGTDATFIKKRVIFDEYGARNLTEQNETTEYTT